MKESSLFIEKRGSDDHRYNSIDFLFILSQINEVIITLIILDAWSYTLSFVLLPQLHP